VLGYIYIIMSYQLARQQYLVLYIKYIFEDVNIILLFFSQHTYLVKSGAG